MNKLRVCQSKRAYERGQALILTVVLIAAGVTLLAYGASTEIMRSLQSDARTVQALALAKQALTGRAIADLNRPGSLPCPDTNNDGIAELLAGNNCPSYIGRLPWRTLGMGDLRDASGERLWYVLSPNFRDHNSVQINSDTKGTLTVYGGSTALALAQEVAAVVIAPGAAFGTQVRDSASAVCATTGTTMPRNLCPANYLESGGAGGWNNASAAGPFMSAQSTATLNDRVAALRTPDFIPLVERRVAGDLMSMLLEYQLTADCNCFPWADQDANGSSNAGSNRGRLPIGPARSITSITRANPGVITTSSAHDLSNGQAVYLTDIAGMTQLNGTIVNVTVVDSVRFSIGVNTNPHTAYSSGGRALPTPLPQSWSRSISGITNANPGVVTTTAPHRFAAGQQIYLSGIAGMTQLNGSVVTVTPLDALRFSIGVNTSTYGSYTSGGTTFPRDMLYLEPNNWRNVIYYTVGRESLENFGLPPTACTTCVAPAMLGLNDPPQFGYSVVLITPGAAAVGQTRTGWTDYIHDPRNRDAQPPAPCDALAQTCADDVYFPPAAKVLNRNRLATIAGNVFPQSCGPNAKALIRNSPCHTTGTNVKSVCQHAATNLGSCSCSSAANIMLEPPCRNTLNPPACQDAVLQLQACTS